VEAFTTDLPSTSCNFFGQLGGRFVLRLFWPAAGGGRFDRIPGSLAIAVASVTSTAVEWDDNVGLSGRGRLRRCGGCDATRRGRVGGRPPRRRRRLAGGLVGARALVLRAQRRRRQAAGHPPTYRPRRRCEPPLHLSLSLSVSVSSRCCRVQPSLVQACFNGDPDEVRAILYKKEDVNYQVV